jgi:hypothetical protein
VGVARLVLRVCDVGAQFADRRADLMQRDVAALAGVVDGTAKPTM